MATTLGENIRRMRKAIGLSQSQLALQLEKGQKTIGNWETGFSEPNVSEIIRLSNIFGISVDKLLLDNGGDVHPILVQEDGENYQNVLPKVHPSVHPTAKKDHLGPGISVGMPAVVTVDTSGAESVVFVPVKARAGYLLGYADQDYITSLPAYRLPGYNNGTYRGFEVDGNSMFNTLHDGDRVIARWATNADFRDDRVYVIVTKNDGILVKRCIFRDGRIVAKSDNNHKGEYPTIVIEMSDVAELWYVVERMTKQLAQPGEIYRRLVELEGRVAIIDQRLNGA